MMNVNNRATQAFLLAIVALLAWPILFGQPPAQAAAPTAEWAENVAKQWSVAETANVDILAADLTPGTSTRTAVAYRITIGVETAGVFNCQIDDGGTGHIEFDFNNGAALTAGRWYTFTLGVNQDYQYNFQVETGADVTLIIDQVYAGAL